MNSQPRKFSLLLSAGVLLVMLTLLLAYLLTGLEKYSSKTKPLPVIGDVNPFSLTNQAGVAVSLADFRGKVWIADVIFTRCPGPCLKMTRQMKELQAELTAKDRLRLVTVTTDPSFDTPSVLAKYAARFDADTSRWTFLTGPKTEIAALVSGGLKLSAVEVKPEERTSANDLYIHSTIFALVDQQARLRGVFDTGGEGVDWPAQKQKIISAARQLEHEP
ncbi:MAG: SCO family protein [Verrucomicrobiota bacterium]